MNSMNRQVVELAQQLLSGGFDRFSDRERRVLTHIAKRLHVTRNVNCAVEEKQTVPDRLADCVARFGGSWTFIVIFTVILVAWVAPNTVILGRFGQAFDPYPYIFLNLILSMVAAMQAPIILMSQNRQAVRDRLAANSITKSISRPSSKSCLCTRKWIASASTILKSYQQPNWNC